MNDPAFAEQASMPSEMQPDRPGGARDRHRLAGRPVVLDDRHGHVARFRPADRSPAEKGVLPEPGVESQRRGRIAARRGGGSCDQRGFRQRGQRQRNHDQGRSGNRLSDRHEKRRLFPAGGTKRLEGRTLYRAVLAACRTKARKRNREGAQVRPTGLSLRATVRLLGHPMGLDPRGALPGRLRPQRGGLVRKHNVFGNRLHHFQSFLLPFVRQPTGSADPSAARNREANRGGRSFRTGRNVPGRTSWEVSPDR